MRPMPKNPFYTPSGGQDRDRPWWYWGRERWTRRDGYACWCTNFDAWRGGGADPTWMAVDPNGSVCSLRATETCDIMAEIDRLHPLPQPRLCAGQVWMSEDGKWTQLISSAASTDSGMLRMLGTAEGASTVTWISYPFLLHDPLDPSLAPWSACV